EQPHDSGSATAILLALAHVLERDPEATVVVVPAGQRAWPEERFGRFLASASRLARRHPDQLFLLGAVPHYCDRDTKWILATYLEAYASADTSVELLDGRCAAALFRQGALWNTHIMAARATTLWEIASRLLPDVVRRFNTLRQVIRAMLEGLAPKEHEA